MVWRIRLAAAAEEDFAAIVEWTALRFGERQALTYAEVLMASIRELEAGPAQLGAKARDDVGTGLFTVHVARRGRKGRHILLCRVGDADDRVIDVIRILHDAMDMPRHVDA